jgi:probable HAF family extracellular repeat protein
MRYAKFCSSATSIATLCLALSSASAGTLTPVTQLFAYPIEKVAVGECVARGINDSGQIVGYNATTNVWRHSLAFVTGPNGKGVSALSLGGEDSDASGINTRGEVVGNAKTPDGLYHAFITDANAVIRILDIPGTISATGINDKGQVVGSGVWDGTIRGYLTGLDASPDITFIETPGPMFGPSGINASGQVIGEYQDALDPALYHAFVTGPNGIGTTTIPQEKGVIFAYAEGINDSGHVTGTQRKIGAAQYKQYVTSADGSTPKYVKPLFGPPGATIGSSINNQGVLVGISTRGKKVFHAPVAVTVNGRSWDINKSIVNLPEGVVLTSNPQINNSNQVVATGTDRNCYIVCDKADCAR